MSHIQMLKGILLSTSFSNTSFVLLRFFSPVSASSPASIFNCSLYLTIFSSYSWLSVLKVEETHATLTQNTRILRIWIILSIPAMGITPSFPLKNRTKTTNITKHTISKISFFPLYPDSPNEYRIIRRIRKNWKPPSQP